MLVTVRRHIGEVTLERVLDLALAPQRGDELDLAEHSSALLVRRVIHVPRSETLGVQAPRVILVLEPEPADAEASARAAGWCPL